MTIRESVSKVALVANRREIKLAEQELKENEELLYAGAIILSTKARSVNSADILNKMGGILVVTSKRIYMCYVMNFSTRTRELRIKDITSVEDGKSIMYGNYIVHGLTETFIIKAQKQEIIKIAKAIGIARDNYEDSTNGVVVNNSNSLNYLEELEKLAELKEKGILSEEEFNSKKQQILDSNK